MPEKNTPITMKDIARELKVSVATVSRALKDSPRISAKRRDEIRRYAEEHNFSPNIIAESLRNRRVIKVIGVIVPQFTHFYFSSVLSGIEEEADKYGYRILVAQSLEQYDREVEVCRSFYENKVCGILVSQAINTSKYDHFTDLINKNVPLVFFDRICTGMNTCRVVVDDYMGAFSAVEYLIKTGCRHIAYYGSSMNLEISKNRYNGWHDALRKHGIDPDSCVKRFCDNREHAERITPEVLNMEDRPDAFFAVNDDTAIGIMYTAKHMGPQPRARRHRLPDDSLHQRPVCSLYSLSSDRMCLGCNAGHAVHHRHQRAQRQPHGCLPRSVQRHDMHPADHSGSTRRRGPHACRQRTEPHDDCGRCIPHHRCGMCRNN